jgi:hypothetical protein
MLIKLPNGLLDGVDLFNYADIDELRGKQQNYLVNRDLVIGNIGHIPKILEDLVLSLQTKEGLVWKGKIADAIYKLPAGDLETLLIKIRENTYGPRYYFEVECPHCDSINKNLRLDLNSLEMTEFPLEERIKPKVFLLPKCNKEVELKPLYLKDLFEVIKITSNKQDTLITSLAVVSIKRLGDNNNVTEKDIEQIAASDLIYLKEMVEKTTLEGVIDTKVEHNCNSCKKDFTSKLNCYEPSFFDHSRGSPTSST